MSWRVWKTGVEPTKPVTLSPGSAYPKSPTAPPVPKMTNADRILSVSTWEKATKSACPVVTRPVPARKTDFVRARIRSMPVFPARQAVASGPLAGRAVPIAPMTCPTVSTAAVWNV